MQFEGETTTQRSRRKKKELEEKERKKAGTITVQIVHSNLSRSARNTYVSISRLDAGKKESLMLYSTAGSSSSKAKEEEEAAAAKATEEKVDEVTEQLKALWPAVAQAKESQTKVRKLLITISRVRRYVYSS